MKMTNEMMKRIRIGHTTLLIVAALLTMVLCTRPANASGIYAAFDWKGGEDGSIILTTAEFEDMNVESNYDLKNIDIYIFAVPIDIEELPEELQRRMEEINFMRTGEVLIVESLEYIRNDYGAMMFDMPEGDGAVGYYMNLDTDEEFKFLIPADVNIGHPNIPNVFKYYHFAHDTDIEKFENTVLNELNTSIGYKNDIR